MIKKAFIVFIIVALLSISIGAFTAYTDTGNDAFFIDSVNRIKALGIMHGDEDLIFGKDYKISREQYIKAIVMISGLEKLAEESKGTSSFTDVSPNRWSAGYINAAVKKNILQKSKSGELGPLESISFAEACKLAVRSLGYTNLSGSEPWNYIDKAAQLGLTKGLNLSSSTALTGWDAAVIIERLWMTRIKQNDPAYLNSMENYLREITTECIVFADKSISPVLGDDEVSTNIGILSVADKRSKIELGSKYKVAIYNDLIAKVYEKIDSIDSVTVQNYLGNTLSYYSGNQLKSMVLPYNTTYIYNNEKVEYSALKNILKMNSTIIFERNYDGSKYEYAYILDPVYSAPKIIKDPNQIRLELGSVTAPIIKDGDIIDAGKLEENDVVYEVTDIWGRHKYVLALNERIEGELTGVLPNKLSPQMIQIDNQNYELSEFANMNKINLSLNTLKMEDKISAVIGYDGKIIDIFPMAYKSGPYVEQIILSNGKIDSTLMDSQVKTSGGVYYVLDGIELEIGKKYKLVIDGNTIVKVGDVLNTVNEISVDRVLNSRVYFKSDGKEKSLVLPQGIQYYYNGEAKPYSEIIDKLQIGTSIVLAHNPYQTGYEYAVIIDPVFSKPEVAINYVPEKQKLGDITFSSEVPVIKNSELISSYVIENMDVVYQISDVWGEVKYILVLNNRVGGTIKSILPSKLSPQSITLSNGKTYEFSEHMKFDKINANPNAFRVGNSVVLLLGHDGKVVDIY